MPHKDDVFAVLSVDPASGLAAASLPPPAAIIPTDIDPSSYDSTEYASSVDYQTLFLNASIAMAVAKCVACATDRPPC